MRTGQTRAELLRERRRAATLARKRADLRHYTFLARHAGADTWDGRQWREMVAALRSDIRHLRGH
jgi:hypothetical protein